ncbi:hypothetical protein K501DRAFT_329012 [Backusella circina FSU 941]|nr:hypothetical protein K501DRAFT_329012 [Backusella circina FSU 941]
MSFTNYFFKTSEPEFFVQCQWRKDIDFKEQQDYTVSLVTLTDTEKYWQVEATRDVLLDFKTPNIESNKLESLLKYAFQGLTTFDGQPIHWKLILQCYFDSILMMRIGSLQMERVSDSNKQSVAKEWFNNTTHQLTKHQQEKASYDVYVKDLEASNQKLKEEMKEMILRKKDTEIELMLKFKEVLNTKKLKIRRLTAKGNDADPVQAPVPAITKKQVMIYRPKPIKKKAKSVLIQEEPEPQVRSDPILDDNDDLFDVFEIDRTAPF